MLHNRIYSETSPRREFIFMSFITRCVQSSVLPDQWKRYQISSGPIQHMHPAYHASWHGMHMATEKLTVKAIILG